MLKSFEDVLTTVSQFQQVLSADLKRSSLLAEEHALIQDFDEQEKLLDSTAQVVQTVFSSVVSNDVKASSKGSSASRVVSWDENEWTQKLERFVALGAELEAGGADASESKVK